MKTNDAFRMICSSLNLGADSIVAILTFYGDASGKKDKTNVAVAGYLAGKSHWDRLKADWSVMLHREGVPIFHRSKMEPPFFEEFREKHWTEEHQQKVLHKLHRIIKRYTIRGVGQSVNTKAFSQIMPLKLKRGLGGPYGWCVQACITYIAHWAASRGDYVHYVFEAGDDGQKEINKALESVVGDEHYREKFRIASYSFASKKGPCAVVQLQPADFLAYESYKQIENLLSGYGRKMRPAAKDLVRKDRDDLRCWTDRGLLRWIEKTLAHPETEWLF